MIKKISLVIGLLLFGLHFGQKEQLQKQSAEIKKQIAAINADLAKSKNESKLSIAYLNNVNQKIALREKVYNNTHKEKKFIEDEIYLQQLEINRQNKEIAVLRKNYAAVLVNAYKNKGMQNKVTFILSSKSVGEAIRRAQYLKQYSEYQERKALEISNAADKLKRALTQRQVSVKEKDKLLVNQQKELQTIEVERKQKEVLLEEFKKNEAKLTAELKQKQAQNKVLEGKIRSIIAEEIRIAKANEATKKKEEAEKIRLAKIAADKEKAKIDLENKAKAEALEKARKEAEAEVRKTAELAAKKAEEEKKRNDAAAKAEASAKDEARKVAAAKEAEEANRRAKEAADKLAAARNAEAALAKKKEEEKKVVETRVNTNFGVSKVEGSNFAENKGKIGFPVDKGQVTHRYGRQPHAVFKNIWEENDGIKISVPAGGKAKCVFPGVVSQITASPDGTKAVIVKHGNYFTVYANLSSTSVSKGQNVAAGTYIGTIGRDYDDSYTLDFQIWNDLNHIDPTPWLSY